MTRIYAALALLALAGFGFWYYGHARYEAGIAHEQTIVQAQADAFAAKARATEQAQAAKLAEVAQRYEQDKADAQAKADRTIAGLRAGTVRLRREWQGCTANGVPNTSTSGTEPDADARLREQGAGNLVRLAAEADAQIRGLQAAVKAEKH